MSFRNKLGGIRILLKFDNWPMLVMNRLLDRRTGLVVYRKDGLEVLVDHRGGDENGTRACLASDMYRSHLAKIRGSGPLRVLDLGANGGGFPLLLRLEKIDLAQVVCVEMNRSTYLRLLVNLEINLGDVATGINAAVSAMAPDSEILLQPQRGGTSLSVYHHRSDATGGHVAVRTTTLQALYDEYFRAGTIDICKIDIEAAEYDVLGASSDSLLQSIRNIVIEFHDPVRTPECVNRLGSLGFAEVTGEGNRATGEATEVRVFSRTA